MFVCAHRIHGNSLHRRHTAYMCGRQPYHCMYMYVVVVAKISSTNPIIIYLYIVNLHVHLCLHIMCTHLPSMHCYQDSWNTTDAFVSDISYMNELQRVHYEL